jgi:hypothetical protein
MNDALIKNQAGIDQGRGQGRSHIARLLQHGLVACVLACTAAGAMAGGQDRNARRDDMQQQSTRDRYDARAQDQRFDQRAYEDARRQEQAMREQAMREQAMQERRSGRMTPDERRELKRQINEANVELYPNARRR